MYWVYRGYVGLHKHPLKDVLALPRDAKGLDRVIKGFYRTIYKD